LAGSAFAHWYRQHLGIGKSRRPSALAKLIGRQNSARVSLYIHGQGGDKVYQRTPAYCLAGPE
jgi:hypothetical protein